MSLHSREHDERKTHGGFDVGDGAGAGSGDEDGAGAGAGAGAAGAGAGGGAGHGGDRRRDGQPVDRSLVGGVHIPGFFIIRGIWDAVSGVIGPFLGFDGAQIPSRSTEATRFLLNFAERYANGDQRRCPKFVEQSFRAAVASANRQSKPLLLYLQSDLHPDTEPFCRQTLCNPAIVEYLNQNFVVWGGSVTSADGYSTMSVCQVTSFPHVAIYIPSSRRGVYQKLWSHEGPATAAELQAKLTAAMAAGAEHVGRVVAQRVAQEEDRKLREEQERAYRESVARDRAKEAAKQEAAEREAVEEAKALSIQLARSSDIEQAREALTDEPPRAGRNAPGGPTTTIRFTLPSGTRVQRRFKSTDTVAMARNYVIVTMDDMGEIPEGVDIGSFEMSTTFPKRTFGSDADTVATTLQDAGLVPQGVLFVAWP